MSNFVLRVCVLFFFASAASSYAMETCACNQLLVLKMTDQKKKKFDSRLTAYTQYILAQLTTNETEKKSENTFHSDTVEALLEYNRECEQS